MPRRMLLILGAVLAVAVIVIAALYLLREQAEERAEKRASEAARATPAVVPASPVPSIGSGAVVRGDWWEVAFTEPKYPDDRAAHRGGLDERLVGLIDRAQRTVDLAIYDFDLANVAEALARASQRQVRVRMVTDTDTLENTRDAEIQAALTRVRQAGIPIVGDERQDIMHHKFTVVDGGWVQTGSWNYTDGDTYRLNNNQLIARSAELAANYTAEFEKLFLQRRFGPNKARGVPNPRIQIGGSRVETLFAPQDNVGERLVGLVEREAQRSILFMAFAYTHDPLGQAMIRRAQSGLTVQGVFETTGSNTQYSEFGRMKQAGLDVYQDGNPYVMHHKVILIDERTVAFGSFNFSDGADRSNDENVVIVEEPRLAEAFRIEYDRVLTLAKNPPVRKK